MTLLEQINECIVPKMCKTGALARSGKRDNALELLIQRLATIKWCIENGLTSEQEEYISCNLKRYC